MPSDFKYLQVSFWLCIRQVEQFFDLRSSATSSRCFRQHNIQNIRVPTQSQISLNNIYKSYNIESSEHSITVQECQMILDNVLFCSRRILGIPLKSRFMATVGSISAALSCLVYPPREETAGRVSGKPCL